MVFHQNLL